MGGRAGGGGGSRLGTSSRSSGGAKIISMNGISASDISNASGKKIGDVWFPTGTPGLKAGVKSSHLKYGIHVEGKGFVASKGSATPMAFKTKTQANNYKQYLQYEQGLHFVNPVK